MVSVWCPTARQRRGGHGELELRFGKDPITIGKERGLIALFPSYTMHRVTPVTKGTRYSLVAWVSGPAFK